MPVSGADGIPRANCGRKNTAADSTVWAVVVPCLGNDNLAFACVVTYVPIGETGRGLWHFGRPGSHALTGGGAAVAPDCCRDGQRWRSSLTHLIRNPLPSSTSSSSRPLNTGGEQILRQGLVSDKLRLLTVAAGQHKGQPASSESLKVTDQCRGIMKGSNLALALTFFTLGAASPAIWMWPLPA